MKPTLTARALTFFVVLSAVSTAFARTQIGILKKDPVAAQGLCTPNLTQNQAEDVLRAFNIRTTNALESEIRALGRGLSQLQKLAGGVFAPAEGARYTFKNGGGNISRQTANGIEMSRGRSQNISSVAYFIHELGHYVGNNNEGALYREYKATVKTPCHFSRYAMKNWSPEKTRNEEFAEVFAAFVTYPALLTEGGPGCQAAYTYFKTRVFDRGELAVCDKSLQRSSLDFDGYTTVRGVPAPAHMDHNNVEHKCSEESLVE